MGRQTRAGSRAVDAAPVVTGLVHHRRPALRVPAEGEPLPSEEPSMSRRGSTGGAAMFAELAPAELPPRTLVAPVAPTIAQIPMSASRPTAFVPVLDPLPLLDLGIIGATSLGPPLLDLPPPPLSFGPRSATRLPHGAPLLDISGGGATVDEPMMEGSAPPSRRGSRASTCSLLSNHSSRWSFSRGSARATRCCGT